LAAAGFTGARPATELAIAPRFLHLAGDAAAQWVFLHHVPRPHRGALRQGVRHGNGAERGPVVRRIRETDYRGVTKICPGK
jgi:hypothetical protein